MDTIALQEEINRLVFELHNLREEQLETEARKAKIEQAIAQARGALMALGKLLEESRTE